MDEDEFVTGPDEVRANVAAYRSEIARSTALRDGMSKVRSWFAFEAAPGEWIFGPSKFVGYRGNDAETYDRRRHARDGGETEKVLSRWFDALEPGDPLGATLRDALAAFLAAHGRAPNARARVNLLKPSLREPARDPRAGETLLARVSVDPAVCGGRPCIRGLRVRVADILDMLAAGASEAEILDDFPYLSSEDVRAALAYAARSLDHRVIEAA